MVRPDRALSRLLHAPRIIRYGCVSACSLSLTQVIILLAQGALGALVANLLGVLAGAVLTLTLYRAWVWREQKGSLRREVLAFLALVLLGLALSSLVVLVLTSLWSSPLAAPLGNIIGFGLVWALRFLALERLVYRARRAPVHARAAA